ncbi:Brix domain-containing protein [Escovopsis weberi]|uniref:Brix domain-containing protein n=1 Tax=Escovopsis weberi TaxID=150374 RepID=A0A0M8MYI3_ESCWE|nr:Brix domain-containing protein [Escovopsis weberi]
MAKRRVKKRTHLGANNPEPASAGHASARDPKSMVIRIGAGEVGSSISQLAADVRKVMEPGTASRLKERRGNRLKDYVVMCGPLGVTHLMLFSRSESGNTNLRIAAAPRGPTLNFRVEKYSLCRDVQRIQRHPKGVGKEFLTPPLLIMNNFSRPNSDAKSKVPKHLESLATTVFQSLFPPINPQTTPLKSTKRVLLLNREVSDEDDGTFIVNFRHYAITTRSTGVSRQVRRINAAEQFLSTKTSRRSQMPNLGKLEDIADYMIGGHEGDGYVSDATSGSEVDTDAEVEVLDGARRKVLSAKARAAAAQAGADEAEEEENVERRAVKLVELGPRMRLRLTKVEEGLCSGKVMWHEYVHKTPEEIKELERRWEKRRQEKEARRKEQKANVEKKKAAKKASGGGKKSGNGDEESEEDDEDEYYSDMDMDDLDSEGLAGDAEFQVNEKKEAQGEWEDMEEEMGNG